MPRAARRVTVHEAKTHLSSLLRIVEAGGDVVIARGSQPIARLVPWRPDSPRGRVFGSLRGEMSLDDRFFEPLPEEELAAWEGR